MDSAESVYNARAKLDSFIHSSNCDGKMIDSLDIRVSMLQSGGYHVIHDIIVLLRPFCDITICEEGDKYPTSSVIIPRLLSIKSDVDKLFLFAEENNRQAAKILSPRNVNSWKESFMSLWEKHISGFLEDEIFLMATIVDPRNSCGSQLT